MASHRRGPWPASRRRDRQRPHDRTPRSPDDDQPGIVRLPWGPGFTFRSPEGETLARDDPDRRRAEDLAIPPAWTDVWVCPDPRGHIQATGRDDAGRKQHLYHPRWRGIREATKFHRLGAFAAAMPRIRDTIDTRLRRRRFTHGKVLALVLALLDRTLIRVGNEHYAQINGTHGATTLENDHVAVDGNWIRLSFVGKSGQERELELRHPRLARQLLRCEEIPGQRMFAYEDEHGWHQVDSSDVNSCLSDVAGDDFTAKDFRTWGATVLVAGYLRDAASANSGREQDRTVLDAVDAVADRLGNSRSVARNSYVDPRVPKAYRLGLLHEAWDTREGTQDRLSPTERAVQRVLDMELPSSPHAV